MHSVLTFAGVNVSLDLPGTHPRCIPFDVPGRPIGYYAMGAHPNWTRMKDYHKFRDRVRTFANAAGVETPVRCTKEQPVIICTQAYFENGTHCDPENIRKGIVDALFYTPQGSALRKGSSDKYCFGAFDQPRYDKHNPRVSVWVYLPEGGTIAPPEDKRFLCPECGHLHPNGDRLPNCDQVYGRRGWRQLGMYDS